MEWIISLLIAGLLLIVLEMFLPGLIVGLCGGICLIVAIIMTYANYGVQAGTWTLVGVISGGLIFILFWMKNFSRLAMGQRLILKQSIEGTSPAKFTQDLKGAEGVAYTSLRPTGTALIQDKRYDVVTEGSWIEAGQKLKVVEIEGSRIVVRTL